MEKVIRKKEAKLINKQELKQTILELGGDIECPKYVINTELAQKYPELVINDKKNNLDYWEEQLIKQRIIVKHTKEKSTNITFTDYSTMIRKRIFLNLLILIIITVTGLLVVKTALEIAINDDDAIMATIVVLFFSSLGFILLTIKTIDYLLLLAKTITKNKNITINLRPTNFKIIINKKETINTYTLFMLHCSPKYIFPWGQTITMGRVWYHKKLLPLINNRKQAKILAHYLSLYAKKHCHDQ